MALTTQSLVLAIVYVLSLVVGLFMTVKAGAFNVAAFIGTVLTLAFIALLVYDTQCLTTGNCTTWSWIRTVLYIFFPALSLILGFFALFGGKKVEQPSLHASLPTMGSFNISEEYTNGAPPSMPMPMPMHYRS